MTMTTATIRRTVALTVMSGLAVLGLGCSDTVRQGRGASYLIIDSIQASQGNDTTLSGQLSSDVITKGIVYEDLGTATLSLAMKDVGVTAPTSNNFITVTRYHVSYRRADGRNVPGVDVPYPFDGAATATVSDQSSVVFVLVRVQAKLEPPLANLVGGGGAQAITTLADVTFYGKDQAGNDVQVTGSIGVNFADWGDPQ
jgi:hypothetical protein